MRIYSLTATFGKLSHTTLRLEPGLNIVSAPNEWGKSTWCAFIVAMLYGIDTKQRSTETVLADKERFAPWSGEPMSGRMELSWNGRDITIERSTKGRVPFGEFRAYETATGLEVPELTSANCGLQLLGVERSVFTQAGFVRLQDMPVTQNESLRRRLNNLVTTGDESAAGDNLGQQLRDLKNKVRHNKTGLLPQAEYERDQLRSQLQQREDLQTQTRQIQARQVELEQQLRLLENHADALRYTAAKQGVEKIRLSQETCARLETELTALQESCKVLPSSEEASREIQKGQALLSRQRELLTAGQQLPPAPVQPNVPHQYQGKTPEQALSSAKEDYRQYGILEAAEKKYAMRPMIAGIAAMCLIAALIICCTAAGMNTMLLYIGAPIVVLIGAAIIAVTLGKSTKAKASKEQLGKKYPGISPENWEKDAAQYASIWEAYQRAAQEHRTLCSDHNLQMDALSESIRSYAKDGTLEQAIAQWEAVLQQHTDLSVKNRELQNAREHAAALESVATTAPEPAFPDSLTLTAPETEAQLQSCRFEQKQLGIKLGQCIGQAETIGEENVLRARLDSVCRRIGRLEAHYRALELAQDVLYQATTALQRRFAPRISKRAQELFSRLTNGRYQRISLSDDLSIHTSAENEDNLRAAQWHSDGTVDQLYLSLRLAVAGEITPQAPLILDDALLRFDDERLKTALEVLQEEAQQKQVILFSCQNREKDLLN